MFKQTNSLPTASHMPHRIFNKKYRLIKKWMCRSRIFPELEPESLYLRFLITFHKCIILEILIK
jgi:hypothetical protein